jgi:hypothetical protein
MLIDELVGHIDILPTIFELCNLPLPNTLPLDGISFAPLLLGKFQDFSHRKLFTHTYHFSFSRRKKFSNKYLVAPGAVRTPKYRLDVFLDHYELYDIIEDPSETNDLISELPKVAEELKKAYNDWLDDVIPEDKLAKNIPIPIGYAESPVVHLPVSYANLHGKLVYNQLGFQHDWITRWKRVDDYLSWEIEVINSGEYEISLLYSCSKENLGSEICIKIGEKQIKALLDKPFDSVEIPGPDRVPRHAPVERKWGTFNMGKITLDGSETELTIKANSIPGKNALELYQIMIKKVDLMY